MSNIIYRIGMGAPYAVPVTVAASSDFDPRNVTGAFIEVTKPSGAKVTWDAVVLENSASKLRIAHDLSVEDLDEVGNWRVWARMTVAGGEERSEVGWLRVLLADQPSPG